MAGLACADALADAGHDVMLFDKGRGAGGRMSTRRVEVAGRVVSFDHGAQYLTVRDPGFAAQVARWEADGHAARWPLAGADAWVGTPGMNAPVRAMAARHRVAWSTRVEALERRGAAWHLAGVPHADGFDAAVIAVPAEQVQLVRHPFADAAARSHSAPCWTVMVAFAEAIGARSDILRGFGAIGWAARDGAKPGRDGGETWVLQATPEWSVAHLEHASEDVCAELLRAFADANGGPLPPPTYLSAHRWRYARSERASGEGALWDPAEKLGVCGDWLWGPRVEAAWLSGRRLADLMAPPAIR